MISVAGNVELDAVQRAGLCIGHGGKCVFLAGVVIEFQANGLGRPSQ